MRTPRTFEAAVEELLAAIARGRLRPGERLPNEGDLAVELEISKPTLRQALRVLERSGVLAVKPGKGGGIFLVSELLPYDAVSAQVGSETEHVIEILRGRRVLEGAITHAAAESVTADDLAELERTVRLLRRQTDRQKITRADAMFHSAVAHATRNRLLVDAERAISRQIAPLRDLLVVRGEDVGRAADLHARQLRAMQLRERAELDAVLDEHFRVLETRFAESLGQRWETLFGSDRRTPAPPFEPPWKKLTRLPDGYRKLG